MAIRNVVSGRGKQVVAKVEGIRELQVTVREIAATVEGRGAARDAQQVLAIAAGMMKAEILRRARAQQWPRRVIASIFTFADPQKNRGKRSAALVGINKRRTMVEWYPGRSRSMRAKSLIIPGTLSAKGPEHGLQKIAMSLATMYEYGTSKMAARPAFRPGVKAARIQVLDFIADGYKRIIESFQKAA